MPRRWIISGMWAVLMSAGMWTFGRNAAAEQPTKPEKIIIRDVIITGNHRMRTEQIKAHLHTQSSKEYNSAVVDDDVRELYKTGQFSNIYTWLEPDGIDHAKIYFSVREMPNMVQKVTFLGAKHIKTEDLQNLTGVRPSTPLDPNLNHLGCLKILGKYAEMGRSFADCQLIKGDDLADTEVVYQIIEGPKVKVRDIQFEGNTFASAARLNTQVKSSRDWCNLIGGTFNKQMFEAEVGELYKYYCRFGFQDVHISPEIQRSPDGSEVTLVFHIHEGPRYRIQEVPDVHGSTEIPREQLIALSSFKPGDYLDEETLKQDIKAITDYMGAKGVDACVDAIPVWISETPGVCNVCYEVMEYSYRIGKIHVSGNKRISKETILAHVPSRPGQILSASKVKQAEKNLAELGLFVVDAATGIRPTITVVDSDAGEDYKDLLITVKEKPKAKPKRTKPGE